MLDRIFTFNMCFIEFILLDIGIGGIPSIASATDCLTLNIAPNAALIGQYHPLSTSFIL